MRIARALVSLLPAPIQMRLRRHHYARKLSEATLEDESDLRVLPQFVKPGMTVLDIGANFGLYTRFLSEQVGPAGKVFSFEPISDSFEVLENNVTGLGLENVSLFRYALSNEEGTAEMRIPKRSDGSLNHYEASLETGEWQGDYIVDRVEMGTLDQWVEDQGIGKIDFIKCDVEGHEVAVLEGARKTFNESRPIVLIEVNQPLCGDPNGEAVREWFETAGFDLFVLIENEVKRWEEGIVQVNYLMIPSELVKEQVPVTSAKAAAAPLAV